jgi:hypothetical protein
MSDGETYGHTASPTAASPSSPVETKRGKDEPNTPMAPCTNPDDGGRPNLLYPPGMLITIATTTLRSAGAWIEGESGSSKRRV